MGILNSTRAAAIVRGIAGAAILSLIPSIFGQPCINRQVRVFVQDTQGRPISNAQVRMDSGSQSAGAIDTGEDGAAVFENLRCGAWVVRASKDGYQELGNRTM